MQEIEKVRAVAYQSLTDQVQQLMREQVLLRGDKAIGVVLESGEEVYGDTIVSAADAKHTFLDMLPAGSLPTDFETAIRNFKFRGSSAKVNFALDGLLGFDFHGRTVGIIGTGQIGAFAEEATRRQGLGCALPVAARMAEAGFRQYEVSAYAREGRRCQHNLNYWTYGDYLGIGAGAHGKISSGHDGRILRRWKPKHPETYITNAGTSAGIGGDEFVLPENRPFDYMLNALRLVDGFSLADFELRTGLGREVITPQLDEAAQRSWLEISGDWTKPTELGMRFANDVMGLFLH
mgnify:CR=1 FL=1